MATLSTTPEEAAAVAFGVLYAAASAGETLADKALNYNAPLSLPAYTALLSNQLWVLMLPLYCAQRNERRLSRRTSSGRSTAPWASSPSSSQSCGTSA